MRSKTTFLHVQYAHGTHISGENLTKCNYLRYYLRLWIIQ